MTVKIFLIIVISLILSVSMHFCADANFVKDLYYSFVSIVAGLILGAVGIFISSITSIYTAIKTQCKEGLITQEQKGSAIIIAKSLVKEVKDNTLFTVITYCIGLVLIIFKNINIPHIEWPIKSQYVYLSKIMFCDFLIFSCIVIMVIATIDTIQAMFKLQEAGDL